MDEFGILPKDLGFRPEGKAAPMAHPSKSNSTGVRWSGATTFTACSVGHRDAQAMQINNGKSGSPLSDFNHDLIFNSASRVNDSRSKLTSLSLVYDKPIFDKHIFQHVAWVEEKINVFGQVRR